MRSVPFLIHKGGLFTGIAYVDMDDVVIVIAVVIVINNLKSKP